jgi:hypothetical protein
MSNPLAITAVTATLRQIIELGIEPEGSGIPVTTRPLDKANTDHTNHKALNLFLYQTAIDAAWSNMDMPRQVNPGETGYPALALTLYYLLSAYGENDDNNHDHRLLGRAMSALYDNPVLSPDQIKAAFSGSDLQNQVEHVRITYQPLSTEELSKLWTAFATQYRPSVAYQVSVVLIESSRAARSPLPVLKQGPQDKGPVAQADMTPPFPALVDIVLPNQQASAHLGDVITLDGIHLDADSVILTFNQPRLSAPLQVPPPPIISRDGSTITFKLPDNTVDPLASAKWPAGFYTVSAEIKRSGQPDLTTNELVFSIAPTVTSALPMTVARSGSGDATIMLTCSPLVMPDQHAILLLGDRQVEASPHPIQTGSLVFFVQAADAGDYLIRLRIDGVDSLLVDRSVTPPVFDTTQRVKIT